MNPKISCSRLPQSRAWTVPLVLLSVALLWGGCVGYQLGSMLPADIHTVYVPTFENETEEPLIETEATRAAIRTIQRDGSLRIASADQADTLLLVTLTGFDLDPIAFDRDRRAAAEEYRLRLRASFALVDQRTGQTIVESPRVEGESTFVFTGDLTSAKQRAIPGAAEDLAQQIISQMVEMW